MELEAEQNESNMLPDINSLAIVRSPCQIEKPERESEEEGSIEPKSSTDLHTEEKKEEICENGNTFLYRNVAKSEEERFGEWTDDEKAHFLECMKLYPPIDSKWGLFSAHVPGRNGYQCRRFYKDLIKKGEMVPLMGNIVEPISPPASNPSSDVIDSKPVSGQESLSSAVTLKWSPRMREPWKLLEQKCVSIPLRFSSRSEAT
jgi:hypothetical protein